MTPSGARACWLGLLIAGCTTPFDRALLHDADADAPASGDGGTGPSDMCGACPAAAPFCVAGRCNVEHGAVSVGVSARFSVIVDRTGALLAFGSNERGQLGVAPGAEKPRFNRIAGTFRSVAAGGDAGPHACAITAEGALLCWGNNTDGESGAAPSRDLVDPPNQVGTDRDWTDISLGRAFGCGLRGGGALYCWGWAGAGRLGADGLERAIEPIALGATKGWKALALGDSFACAIDANAAIQCWGSNDLGALGGAVPTPAPAKVPLAPGFARLCAGDKHACAVRSTGEIHCWGDGSPPAQVGTDADWSTVACGATHTCASKRDGTMYCWGKGNEGQLGLLQVAQADAPMRVGDRSDWVTVIAQTNQTCGIVSDGRLYCWGNNSYGQFALDGVTLVRTPSLVPLAP